MTTTFELLLRQGLKRAAIAGGLEAAWLLRTAGLMRAARGRGAIFTLHHVRPRLQRRFDPNAHLDVTPEFLDAAITRLKRDGYRFAALDDVPALLADDGDARPFACFTLDDGFRDNAVHALGVFERHDVPFTVFVCGGFADRTHTMWWETAAELLNRVDGFSLDFGTGTETVPARTLGEKDLAFERIATFVRGAHEAEAVDALDRAARAHGIDAEEIVRDLTMEPHELRALAARPHAYLGAHTLSHRALAQLTDAQARAEIGKSADRVETITGKRPRALAYPYGDGAAVSAREPQLAAELGLTIAVTTRPGTLTAASALTALPRISLNGHFQTRRYVSALASGIPFRLLRR